MAPGGPFSALKSYAAAGDSGRKTTSRVRWSFKAVRVDKFDGFIETYNFMGVPLSYRIRVFRQSLEVSALLKG
jgi:hypothetical protein